MNGVMLQGFEWYLRPGCRLWRKIRENAGKYAGMGFTSIWLPPAAKGAFGNKGTGYACYDLYDLGEFDQKGSVETKYGTKKEYLEAIEECHRCGLSVYADVVLDHKIGADEEEVVDAVEYSSSNRTLPVSGKEEIRAWTKFTFPGRKGKYSDFIWDWTCFDGIDWDEGRKKNAIYLFEGKEWNEEVDPDNGNFDYLMGADVDFDNEAVCEELTRWGKWYLDFTRVDGFRLDAVKHIKAEFYRDWLSSLREYAGKELFTVGEYWSGDVAKLEGYLGLVNGSMSLFDVPLHFSFYNISHDGIGSDLRTVWDGSLTKENASHAVTFVDNHDTEPGQGLESFVEPWFKPLAYALILLREEGYPCVFWGDLYGIPQKGAAPVKELPALLRLRRDYAAGEQEDYFGDSHCIGWVRKGSGMAVVLSTHEDHVLRMNVGKEYGGCTYHDALGNCPQAVQTDEEGWGDFPVKDGTASVWIIGGTGREGQ